MTGLIFTNAEFCRFVVEAKEQRERAEVAEAEVARLRAALGSILAGLEEMEWRPEQNMAGGTTQFCPICGGTPSVYRQNPTTARPDGHWLDGIRVRGLCPIAHLLDVTRVAIQRSGVRDERSACPSSGGE